jgi:DNA-binding NtrC family response regulator
MPTDDHDTDDAVGHAARVRQSKRAGQRVLVFSDAELTVGVLNGLLGETDYEVQQLSSPIGATAACLNSGASVVIIDVSVGGLPGTKLLQILRKNTRLASMGIVLLGEDTEFDVEARMPRAASRSDAFVSKLVLADALVPAVDRLVDTLERRRRLFAASASLAAESKR